MADHTPSSHSQKLERQGSDTGIEAEDEDLQRSVHAHRYTGLAAQQGAGAKINTSGRKYFDSTDKKIDAPAGHADGESPVAGANKMHVLLVEDVAISQRVARVALNRARYKVDVATDGETAVERYNKTPYGIVLMDIHLPKMDGTQAVEHIRAFEREKGIPPAIVFALSGSSEPSDLAKYQSVGMNGCIAKGNVLADTLREALSEFERDPAKFVVRNLEHH